MILKWDHPILSLELFDYKDVILLAVARYTYCFRLHKRNGIIPLTILRHYGMRAQMQLLSDRI